MQTFVPCMFMQMCVAQEHADKLSEVLDIVIAHQGAPLAARLVSRLLAALVEPTPEDYRHVLRRLAALEGKNDLVVYCVLQATPWRRWRATRACWSALH